MVVYPDNDWCSILLMLDVCLDLVLKTFRVAPRVSALAGCDRLVSEHKVVAN